MNARSASSRADSRRPGFFSPVGFQRDPNRPTAILICYSCGPGAGSESGAGWMWAKAATEVADVIVFTHPTRFRPAIEASITELELPMTVHFVDLPWKLRRLFPGKLLGMVKYCIWQTLVGREIRRYESQERIDVVHHVTWASDSLPSGLSSSRAPVRIWGPVGGTTHTTPSLYRYLTLRGQFGEAFRDAITGPMRAVWGTKLSRHATLVVALNQDVERKWSKGPTPVVLESNTGLSKSELGPAACFDPAERPEPFDGSRQRVALFVGRLIPLKGLRLAVESLRHAPGWKLVVLGEGPDRRRAEALANRCGVADRLEFRGQVPRAEVLAAFRTADALLFPSFHDSSSWAVGEASFLGCPIVCLDAAGSALQAGRNAHVVPIAPASSLAVRIGQCLEGLIGRGEPDDSLRSERIVGLLKSWYAGTGRESAELTRGY